MAESASDLTSYPAGRTDEVEQMRHQVDDLRSEIARDVYELESRVRATFDIRRQISKHPFAAAAIALGGAFVVARIVNSLLRGARRPEAERLSRRARC
jgi:hypothetical protein